MAVPPASEGLNNHISFQLSAGQRGKDENEQSYLRSDAICLGFPTIWRPAEPFPTAGGFVVLAAHRDCLVKRRVRRCNSQLITVMVAIIISPRKSGGLDVAALWVR